MKTSFTQTFHGATFAGATQTNAGPADYWVTQDGLHIFALSDRPGDYIATLSPDLYLI